MDAIAPARYQHAYKSMRNANELRETSLPPIDKLAVALTDKVSFGYFAIIFT